MTHCIIILQDRSIAVWDMQSPTDINLRRVLVGHRAAVNVVDFDQKYIVSASGDRTIKVCISDACSYVILFWDCSNCIAARCHVLWPGCPHDKKVDFRLLH